MHLTKVYYNTSEVPTDEEEVKPHWCPSCRLRGLKREMQYIEPLLARPGFSCDCGRWEPA